MDRDTNKIKKPARRDLEARKEQNRNASRNYRACSAYCSHPMDSADTTVGEKRKQRLSLLNQLLDPSNVVGISEAGGSASQDISRQPMLDVPVDSFVPDTAFATYNAVDSFGNNWVHSDPVVKIPMSNQIALSFATPWPLGDPQSLQVPQRFTSIVPTEPTPDTSNSRSLNHSNSPGRDTAFQNVLTSVDSLSLSEKRSIIRHLQQTTDTPPPTPTGNQTRLQVESLLFAQAISRAGPRSPPSQYANGAGIYGAVFANCYALGMGSVDEIMAEDGCSLFSVTPDQGHDRAVLPTVKAKFSGLSIHLQPSEGQLTFGHHPYIVCSPNPPCSLPPLTYSRM